MTVFISIDITIKLHCYYLFLLLYHVAIWTIVHKVFCSHSATHSFMHICIHLFLSLCVIPSVHSSFNAFFFACMQAFIQACSFNFVDFFLFQSLIVYSPIIAFHSLIHSWVHPSICPSIHSFNLSFMHSCIHHAFTHLGVSPFSIFLNFISFWFIHSITCFILLMSIHCLWSWKWFECQTQTRSGYKFNCQLNQIK
jgi:hypothetical protein